MAYKIGEHVKVVWNGLWVEAEVKGVETVQVVAPIYDTIYTVELNTLGKNVFPVKSAQVKEV